MTHLTGPRVFYLATLFWQICKSHITQNAPVCKSGPELEIKRDGHQKSTPGPSIRQ